MSNEADTCRKYIVPKLIEAEWDDKLLSIAEQFQALTSNRTQCVVVFHP
jgi:hypothetical protein